MSKTRRSFSASEKLSIINEADQFGVTATLRKHNLSPTVFRRWKENFNLGGVANLQSYNRLRNPEVDALEEQIRVLKNNIAKQQIELEFKAELLKKSQSLEQRRSRDCGSSNQIPWSASRIYYSGQECLAAASITSEGMVCVVEDPVK
jgi:putative transposase